MQDAILAVNAGSSSLKFALYPRTGASVAAAAFSGSVEGLEPGGSPVISARGAGLAVREALPPSEAAETGFDRALSALAALLDAQAGSFHVTAVAHRIVHGGDRFAASVMLDDAALDYLTSLNPLAPLHQPHNLAGVRAFRQRFAQVPQIGCFDTAFHATLPPLERRFALPKAINDAGIRRYGFHGLSYRYVQARLHEHSVRAGERVLIAHLGNGASLCGLMHGKSVATSMGFSALDGLMMGTRSGAVDPGVLLHLLRQGWDVERLERMLYRESGLGGVSGISADMRTLQASDHADAKLAIDLFIYRLVREAGALAAILGGVDLVAFTGGIGENDRVVRRRVCEALGFLGVTINESANLAAGNGGIKAIHAEASGVEVWVVPTDEGMVAASDAAMLTAS